MSGPTHKLNGDSGSEVRRSGDLSTPVPPVVCPGAAGGAMKDLWKLLASDFLNDDDEGENLQAKIDRLREGLKSTINSERKLKRGLARVVNGLLRRTFEAHVRVFEKLGGQVPAPFNMEQLWEEREGESGVERLERVLKSMLEYSLEELLDSTNVMKVPDNVPEDENEGLRAALALEEFGKSTEVDNEGEVSLNATGEETEEVVHQMELEERSMTETVEGTNAIAESVTEGEVEDSSSEESVPSHPPPSGRAKRHGMNQRSKHEFSCLCGVLCKNQSSLRKHLLRANTTVEVATRKTRLPVKRGRPNQSKNRKKIKKSTVKKAGVNAVRSGIDVINGSSDSGPQQCRCGKWFRSIHSLFNHIYYHTNKATFMCKMCENKFGSKMTVLRHLQIIHKLTDEVEGSIQVIPLEGVVNSAEHSMATSEREEDNRDQYRSLIQRASESATSRTRETCWTCGLKFRNHSEVMLHRSKEHKRTRKTRPANVMRGQTLTTNEEDQDSCPIIIAEGASYVANGKVQHFAAEILAAGTEQFQSIRQTSTVNLRCSTPPPVLKPYFDSDFEHFNEDIGSDTSDPTLCTTEVVSRSEGVEQNIVTSTGARRPLLKTPGPNAPRKVDNRLIKRLKKKLVVGTKSIRSMPTSSASAGRQQDEESGLATSCFAEALISCTSGLASDDRSEDTPRQACEKHPNEVSHISEVNGKDGESKLSTLFDSLSIPKKIQFVPAKCRVTRTPDSVRIHHRRRIVEFGPEGVCADMTEDPQLFTPPAVLESYFGSDHSSDGNVGNINDDSEVKVDVTEFAGTDIKEPSVTFFCEASRKGLCVNFREFEVITLD